MSASFPPDQLGQMLVEFCFAKMTDGFAVIRPRLNRSRDQYHAGTPPREKNLREEVLSHIPLAWARWAIPDAVS